MRQILSFWAKLILLIGGVIAVILLINVSIVRSRRSLVQVELESVSEYQIRGQFQSLAFLSVIWDNLVQATGGEVVDFSNRSEKILKDYESDVVESLQLAPEGKIQYVYPYSFSDEIGTNIEKDDRLKDIAVRSRYSGLDTVSAPEPLEDGDYRLYFCHPVYRKDRVGKAQFWGYSIVTARVSRLVSGLAIENLSTRSRTVLYRMDVRHGDQILMDDTEDMLKNPVRHYFSVPNGTLVLDGMWEGGWITQNELLFEVLIGVIVVILSALFLMNLRIRKNMRALSRISYTDELTGLYNRHMLRKKFDDLDGVRKQISILFLDFDHFKEINDKEGHDAGDETLKQGSAFFASLFGRECCYRYGGDEFLMLITGMTDEEVREKIAKVNEFRSIRFMDRDISVSVSGGFASAECGTTAELRDLIRVADHNLYYAKEHGRAQIIGGDA